MVLFGHHSNNVISTICLCLFFVTVKGQWVQTGGPEGASTYTIEKVGNQIWVGTDYGVYTSDNNGASWQIHPLFTNVECFGIDFSNDTILVLYSKLFPTGINWGLIYYCRSSFDGGLSWSNPKTFSNFNITGNDPIKKLGNIYLLQSGNGVNYVSYNAGLNWSILGYNSISYSEILYGEENGAIIGLQPNPYSQYHYYYLRPDGLWINLDTTNSFPTTGAYIIGSNILMSNYSSQDQAVVLRILRSQNYGGAWDTIYTSIPGQYNNGYFRKIYDIIYYFYPQGCIKSADNGTSWEVGTYPSPLFYDSVSLPTGEYLTTSEKGIQRLTSDFSTSFFTNSGIRSNYIGLLKSHNGVLYSGNYDNTWRSIDGGTTWNKMPEECQYLRSFLFLGDTILCATENNGGKLVRSFDNGFTWDIRELPFNHTDYSSSSIEELNGVLYTSASDSIMYSSDWGLTWRSTNSFAVNYNGINNSYNTGFLKSVNGYLYVVTDGGLILKYEEASQNWNFIKHFYSSGGNELFELDGLLVGSGNSWFGYSNDDGITWTTPNLIVDGAPINQGMYTYLRNLISIDGVWFAQIEYKAYYSNDQGNSWNEIHNTPNFLSNGGLTSINKIIYSGSKNSSVWKLSSPLKIFSGNVYFDGNKNGIKDSSDYPMNGLGIKTVISNFISTTNQGGNYVLLTEGSGDSIKVVLPSPYCSTTPKGYQTNGDSTDLNFGVYIHPGIRDLSIDLTNVNLFRPGFPTSLKVTVLNKGSVEQRAEVKLLLDSSLDFLSSFPPINSQNGDTLIWISDTLSFLETATFSLILIGDQSANIGDSIHCFSSVSPVLGDTAAADNFSALSSIYVGSYDPNDKTCKQGEFFTPEQLAANEEVQFSIRFQNTGTNQADNVRITDTLSGYLDLNTFRIISSSHTMRYEMSGIGIVNFYFNGINLPDSNVNELASHGYVKYGIRCKSGVSVGNAITNRASIYFENEEAIITNTTTTLIAYPVILTSEKPALTPIIGNAIVVYPNPTADFITIDTRGISTHGLTLSIIDLKGSVVKTIPLLTDEFQISVLDLESGVYIGSILNVQLTSVGSFKFVRK